MKKQEISIGVLYIAAIVFEMIAAAGVRGEVFLPGMQPNEAGIEFAKVQQCKMCHSQTPNGEADPFFSWQGGMMAQAARDPIFRATVAIANQDVEGVGEYCFRCHTPRGWLEGRSTPADGSQLNYEDLQGISCDVCHRLIDPMGEEAKALVEHDAPGYGNAMMVADPQNVVRGPYERIEGAMPHLMVKSEYHASSQLCATCHNVSNPLQAEDVNVQPPHAYGHIERTYSEWALSDFAKEGRAGSCQGCHYPLVEGGGQSSRFTDLHREYFALHGPVGGSTWVQQATAMMWKDLLVSKEALEAGSERAREILKTATKLELKMGNDGKAVLRITNLTGHKLPTGYPEGRRMWVHARFLDAEGNVVDEIGGYGEKQDMLNGQAVTVSTLLDDGRTTIYESLPGISEANAEKFGKQAGKSFHFVLNDVIVKDNRIPPRGFKNEAFEGHLCQPVGKDYADGQYWDDVEMAVAEGTAKIEVRLMYQSMSWEYLKFLVEENRTDDWSKRLYEVWQKTGRCAPEVMAEVSLVVGE